MLAFLGLQTGQAQQDPHYSQYMFNTLALNPGYTGTRDALSITGLLRTQWVGIEGAPQTQTLSIHTPFYKKSMGLGLQVVADQIGISKTTSIYASYAFHLKFEKAILSMGLQGGFTQFRADFTSVNHSFNPNVTDPAFAQDVNTMLPNVGFGLFYYTDRFYAGLSAPQLINNEVAADGTTQSEQVRHVFLTSGYVFTLSENLKLKPSFLIKYAENAPLSMDFNANLWFFDKFAFGLSYREGDSMDFLFEWLIKPNLQVGYAYDLTLTELQQYNSGSHEIMLRYDLNLGGNKNPDKVKIISPRLF